MYHASVSSFHVSVILPYTSILQTKVFLLLKLVEIFTEISKKKKKIIFSAPERKTHTGELTV